MDLASIVANDLPLNEVVRYVFLKLLQQGRPAVNPDSGMCLYRELGEDGADRAAVSVRCGIGHLIADDKYSPMIESEPAINALSMAYGREWVSTNVDSFMLDQFSFMQSVHDYLGGSGNGPTREPSPIDFDSLHAAVEHINEERMRGPDLDNDEIVSGSCDAAAVCFGVLREIREEQLALVKGVTYLSVCFTHRADGRYVEVRDRTTKIVEAVQVHYDDTDMVTWWEVVRRYQSLNFRLVRFGAVTGDVVMERGA